MPGSSTAPGRQGARIYAPVRVAFRFRNGVGTRDMNLCEAQWLACALPYRRFAAALTDDSARLGANVDRYSFIASDLHRLLVAGLPAHCERFWTLPVGALVTEFSSAVSAAPKPSTWAMLLFGLAGKRGNSTSDAAANPFAPDDSIRCPLSDIYVAEARRRASD